MQTLHFLIHRPILAPLITSKPYYADKINAPFPFNIRISSRTSGDPTGKSPREFFTFLRMKKEEVENVKPIVAVFICFTLVSGCSGTQGLNPEPFLSI